MTTYPVSVIIPAHNAGQTIKRAIDSAFEAGAREVVVVNDGSRDGTGIYANSLKDIYQGNYQVFHTGDHYFQPAGVVYARNLGISLASYNFIIPLDADDTLMPDGIKLLYQMRDERAVVYGGHLKAGSGEFVPAPPPMRLSKKNLTGATYGFWRDDWAQAGGYHPDFNLGCEDWALMCALVQTGCRLIRVEYQPIYVYSEGGKRAARCMQYADALTRLLHEHYPMVFNSHAEPSR